ncbi:MAG: GldG family protein [Nannocystis sp.]|nr:GldG family protein [Nannocystis sp.]MBA3547881.1 GldG family protein [Nannocystis sp.]
MHPRIHRFIRLSSIAVTAISLGYVAQRSNLRADVTEERLSQITQPTLDLMASITPERPVTIHAYVSREVPRAHVAVRSQLLSVLREMEARGGAGLKVRIVEPEPFSPEAQEAIDNYGITPQPVTSREGGQVQEMQVFLGVAFVSGPNEAVIPFLDRGLSPEYEIVRALRTVTLEKKKVVGVMRTDATIMGNFDLQARRQQPAWRIIQELRKQYEVRSLNPGAEIPADVDVLLVPQLSSMTAPNLEVVEKYVAAGRPALLTVDPMPLFEVGLAPGEPMKPPPGQQQQNMFGPPPEGEPKGDFVGMLRKLGVEWDPKKIVFDTDNPHPDFENIPPHVVFVAKRPDGTDPFAADDPVLTGISEVVVLFGGELKPASGFEAEFVPLLKTGTQGGFNTFDEMVQRHMLFGLQGPMMPPNRTMVAEPQVMAARVSAGTPEAKTKNVIVIADLDLFGDQFFVLNERGGDQDGDGVDEIKFDNVAFLMNAIDTLSGDVDLVDLRGRRSKYRRIDRVDEMTKEASARRNEEIKVASTTAEADIKAAQAALDAAVKKINDDATLDETTKAVLLKSAEEAENRRLNAKREKIQADKTRAVTRTQTEHLAAVRQVEDKIRSIAVLVPPLPAILLGGFIFLRKRRREQDAIPTSRKRGSR